MDGCLPILIICFIFGPLLVDFASSKCASDADCPQQQVCCSEYICRLICHCVADSNCSKGEECVNSNCIPAQENTAVKRNCYRNVDCRSNNRYKECCSGKCQESCTQKPTPQLPCIGSRECPDGERCQSGKCRKENSNSSSKSTLTKAGFLSAAILTGSVFLLIICCCFIKESKYGRRRYVERQRRSRRSRNRRRSTHQARLVSHGNIAENRSFSSANIGCDNGFFIQPPGYPGELNTNDHTDRAVCHDQLERVSPPPYHTLSFVDLPPSYEEALQNEDNNSYLAQVA